jgi:hypothetical protein
MGPMNKRNLIRMQSRPARQSPCIWVIVNVHLKKPLVRHYSRLLLRMSNGGSSIGGTFLPRMARQEGKRQETPLTPLFTREKVLYCGDKMFFSKKRLSCTKARKQWLRETTRKSLFPPRSTAPYDRLRMCSPLLREKSL